MLNKNKSVTAWASQLPLARARAIPALGAVLILAGCAVGPDFKKPPAPDVDSYTAQPLSATVATPGTIGGNAQHFTKGGTVTADWWMLFHSKPLDALIAEALKNNPDLKAAQAALHVADESVMAQRGAYFPRIAAGMSAARQSEPLTLAPVPNYPVVPQQYLFNLFTPQVNVSYVPDVFGLNQRTVESLKAQRNVVRYEMAATYNTLVANVVVTAIQLASVNAQIAATQALVHDGTNMLQILQYQYDKGYASGVDLAAEKTQLATVQAALPPLVKQQAQLHNLMATLVGRYPSHADVTNFTFADMTLPTDIPVSLPSSLVAQRPDILQAQANLHAAGAQVGIAVAARLPNITLTGAAGSTALEFSKLFTTGTSFWTIGADLMAPIFEGGTLLHQEHAARAAYDQAKQQYRSTVLTAFANVADTLVALEQDAKALKAAADADRAAKAARDIAEAQLKDGYGSELQRLAAVQAFQQAHIGLLQAQANRFADTAALFQALGGGWWHHTDLIRAHHGKHMGARNAAEK
jgi:NodT family efflux transporter outer membrane factor (OMF) lipoprotein